MWVSRDGTHWNPSGQHLQLQHTFAGNTAPVGPSSCSTPQGRWSRGPRPTCSTRLIHWKLSSSEASGRCSATSTIRSSWRTVTENTAILGGGTEAMTTQHDRVQTLHPMRHKLRWGWRETWSTECKRNQTSSNVEK